MAVELKILYNEITERNLKSYWRKDHEKAKIIQLRQQLSL